ncbi:MAG: DUF4097 family beta strand repeat-containing protein [Bacteroidetes bacterium]|nr:DUF4097 family beta strand repeat-containing protein [Bacteroidota bacterium]
MDRRVVYSIIILFTVIFFAGCSININNSDSQAEYREDFSFYIPVTNYDEISVSNINGSITIIGVDGLDQVEVTGEKIVSDEFFDQAKSHITDISVDIVSSGSLLGVRTTQPNTSGNRTYQVDYEIRVPSGWAVSVTDVNGTIEVDNIINSVSATLTNGTFSAYDIVGDLNANLTNGNIDADVTLLAGNRCELTTTNGNIALWVPPSTSAAVSASVVNGSVTISGLSIAVSSSSRTYLQGTMGKGEASISLSTVNGNIQLNSL